MMRRVTMAVLMKMILVVMMMMVAIVVAVVTKAMVMRPDKAETRPILDHGIRLENDVGKAVGW
jgi:hypothetical protein